MVRQIFFLLLLSSTLWAQSVGRQTTPPPQSGHTPPDAARQPTARPSPGEADDLAQMRTDLNQMEGLLNNMSSEITFLRDQNLQILLNSNARMWTILIRDLRLQINREEQRRAGNPASPAERSRPQN